MQIESQNKRTIYPSFKRINEEKIIAEKILKNYLKTTSYTKSNSYVRAKINKYYAKNETTKYATEELLKKLVKLAFRYNENIVELRQNIRSKGKFKTFEDFCKTLENEVKKSGYANCGELNYPLQYRFLRKKIPAHMICMATCSKTSGEIIKGKDHSFVVFNLKPDAILNIPETWGSKAIIADAWCNIVMNANDALEYFKYFFKIDKRKEFLILKNADKVKIKD